MYRLGIAVGDATVLLHLKRCVRDGAEPPKVISIDDWNWRMSQNYGTIIVVLERRTVMDILEDRNVENCSKWLRLHPELEVVSRDGCCSYAKAANQGVPQALQVADQFHLLQNLRRTDEHAWSRDRQSASV